MNSTPKKSAPRAVTQDEVDRLIRKAYVDAALGLALKAKGERKSGLKAALCASIAEAVTKRTGIQVSAAYVMGVLD